MIFLLPQTPHVPFSDYNLAFYQKNKQPKEELFHLPSTKPAKLLTSPPIETKCLRAYPSSLYSGNHLHSSFHEFCSCITLYYHSFFFFNLVSFFLLIYSHCGQNLSSLSKYISPFSTLRFFPVIAQILSSTLQLTRIRICHHPGIGHFGI